MSKYDEQMKRWDAILGDTAEGTQEEALEAFFEHLKANLKLPCEVTGTEDFRWEEPYVLGGWSQQEYKRLKKTQPSYTDKYELMDLERGGWSEWMMFDEDIVAHVSLPPSPCMSANKPMRTTITRQTGVDQIGIAHS